MSQQGRGTLVRMGEQARYQVRFGWGAGGAAAIAADADVVVQVDVVRSSPSADRAASASAAVILADLRTAAAAAKWIHALQQRLRRRITIAVVAAGTPRPDGSLRTDVEDLLAASAVIDGLGALGIDATSPEAAATEAAYRTLRRAAGHLLTASTTAEGTAIDPRLATIDETLGASDAEVIRAYSDAGDGVKSSAREFMQ